LFAALLSLLTTNKAALRYVFCKAYALQGIAFSRWSLTLLQTKTNLPAPADIRIEINAQIIRITRSRTAIHAIRPITACQQRTTQGFLKRNTYLIF
jgi:hypothetical protein